MVLVLLTMWHVRPVFAWESESRCPHETMRLVNDYWMSTHPGPGNAGWAYAVYQLGNLATYNALGDAKYLDYAHRWATQNRWKIVSRVIRATDVRASTHEGNNVPANARDNNLATRWAAYGDGQWIEFDLRNEVLIGVVAIACFQGDQQ
jgi:hypothetical protein